MKENISENPKNKKMSIQSCLNRQAKNIDYKKDNVDKRWKQIDTLPVETQNIFKTKISVMTEIMTKHKLSDYYFSLEQNKKNLTIDILCEFSNNFGKRTIDIKNKLENSGENARDLIDDACLDIASGLYKKDYITKDEYTNNNLDEYGKKVYMLNSAESKAKGLITNLPSFKLRCEHMSLNEILTADDLFDFLDKGKFEDLEKVFDANVNPTELERFTKKKMMEFGSVLLERIDVKNSFENAQKAMKFYYQNLPQFIQSQLINDKTSEDERYMIEENSTPKLPFAWNLLKKYDENIKSGKIKDKNGDDFKKLQQYVSECTKNIFSGSRYGDISKHMSNISKFINMYETKDTTDFNSLNNDELKNSIDQMMKFFNSEKIIDSNIVGLGLQGLSGADIGSFDQFWEALKFFFKHPIAFWYKENKAEYRIKVERFADEIKLRLLSTSEMINGENKQTNKQTSVFTLLNDARKILPQLEDNTKDSIL